MGYISQLWYLRTVAFLSHCAPHSNPSMSTRPPFRHSTSTIDELPLLPRHGSNNASESPPQHLTYAYPPTSASTSSASRLPSRARSTRRPIHGPDGWVPWGTSLKSVLLSSSESYSSIWMPSYIIELTSITELNVLFLLIPIAWVSGCATASSSLRQTQRLLRLFILRLSIWAMASPSGVSDPLIC
jgi:hypothetical protein